MLAYVCVVEKAFKICISCSSNSFHLEGKIFCILPTTSIGQIRAASVKVAFTTYMKSFFTELNVDFFCRLPLICTYYVVTYVHMYIIYINTVHIPYVTCTMQCNLMTNFYWNTNLYFKCGKLGDSGLTRFANDGIPMQVTKQKHHVWSNAWDQCYCIHRFYFR